MKVKELAAWSVAMMVLLCSSLALAGASGGILEGNYGVYKNGRVAEKLSGKNPLLEDSLLVCNGKCVVDSGGVSLVAAENAIFAVKNQGNQFNLLVKNGKVDFTLVNPSKEIAFYSLDGKYTVGSGIISASTSSSIRGYMQVVDNKTEIGLYDGRMVLSTEKGPMTLDADHKIVLAMAEIPENGSTASEGAASAGEAATGSFWAAHSTALIVGGVVVAGTGIGIGVSEATSGDDNGHHNASPSQ